MDLAWRSVACALLMSVGFLTPAAAQDFSRGAWVRGCEDTTGTGRYVVVCDGYGGALFDARKPPDCEFGSRFACRRTTLCELAQVMTIRDWSGAAMSMAQLGCAVGGSTPAPPPEPPDPYAQCKGKPNETLCRRCLSEGREDLLICQRNT